jgi:hypothetical protein
MKNTPAIKSMSDNDLLRSLSELLQSSRRVEAELIAHMAEVDERRLYQKTSSSMFSYCTEILHLAEHEAFLPIKVARASREHPVLLEMLSDGRLHLSGIVVLRPHLTEANQEELLSQAAHKTRRQIEELVAELQPKPDVPSTIRKLPERREKAKPTRAKEPVPEPVVDHDLELTMETLPTSRWSLRRLSQRSSRRLKPSGMARPRLREKPWMKPTRRPRPGISPRR